MKFCWEILCILCPIFPGNISAKLYYSISIRKLKWHGKGTKTIQNQRNLMLPYCSHSHFPFTFTPYYSLDNHSYVFHLYNFILKTLYKWNHTLCKHFGLYFSTQHNSWQIHSGCLMPQLHGMKVPQFVYNHSSWRTSRFFPVWGYKYSAKPSLDISFHFGGDRRQKCNC